MPDTAGDVCLDVAQKFNDPSQSTYTAAVVLPFVSMAARSLEQYIEMNDIPLIRQKSSVLQVLALATELASYPVDFVEPIEIKERASGSTDLFDDMDEKAWEPNTAQDTTLRWWVFRDAKIKFLGATVNREISLKYHRTISALTVVGSNIEPLGARPYLAALAAQMIARDVANSPTKAIGLQKEVDDTLDLLIRRLVKNKQGLGVRRRGYRGYGRSGRSGA